MDKKLKDFLSAKQPFLQPSYTLKQLADDTHIPLHHLSALINQHYGVRFNDFINYYRVNHCKLKILNDEWKQKKLEAIGEESGFNNRNTFSTAFKKVIGISPSGYLKRIREKTEEEV
jgi:AraC-like DNA-binding protein